MTGFLIDTNVICELRKRGVANRGVVEWFSANEDADMWLSVLVVAELRRGVERIRRRDHVAGRSIAEWLDELVVNFDDRIIEIDLPIALIWAELGVPDPVPVVDGLLAATALTRDLTVVTRNTVNFEPTGARVLNPFTR